MLKNDEYIIYLRKSRADNPHESVEEVLIKHETILQEYAEKNYGGRIPEHCIFREIVSGETIEERPEMRNVLTQIENPNLKGVLVVEPQRLSRGDLEDCGKIVNAFRYSGTYIVTPNMSYNLQNKMERKFFEQELLRGNDYLEYTKEILLRGRIAAVKRGCYIGNLAPFGYDKVKIGEDHTLKPNDMAPFVLMVFEMFVNEGKTQLQIARYLDSIGVKPARSAIWEKCSIRSMLKNQHYIGKVVFGQKRGAKVYEDGEIKHRRFAPESPEDIVIADGLHPAIVPLELFEAAQQKIANHPMHHRAKKGYPLKNPLAGLIWCSKCGRALAYHPYKHARSRIECRNRNGCGSKSAFLDDVVEDIARALEIVHLPELEAKLKNDEGNAAVIQKNLIEKLYAELEEMDAKEDRLHELLESRTYTEETFLRRHKKLSDEKEKLKSRIFTAKQNMPQNVDYGEKIIKLKDAVTGVRDNAKTPEEKNILLKSIVEKVIYEFTSHEGKGKVRYKLHVFLKL